MFEEFEVFESTPALLRLTEGEVDALLLIGKELASTVSWWGASSSDSIRSVVAVDWLRDGSCRVTFRNVIGILRVGDKQINVKPKIPMNHFTFIASRSELAPRVSSTLSQVQEGVDFTTVISRWCVDAAEVLLRQGLRKDYSDRTDELEQVQGSIHPMQTTMLNAIGVPLAVCSFQEFTEDTMLNRVVKAACLKVAGMGIIDSTVRYRARQVAYRMGDVTAMRPNDLRVKVDRLSANYSRVLNLARLVLSGMGLTVAVGRHIGTAFLIRTPELIEDGLRSILEEELQDIKVTKRRLMIGDSGLSINPDLVFGNTLAIGDVKYRLLGKDWSRSDFNQAVTFATGFRTSSAAIIGFTNGEALPRPVSVGDVKVRAFGWGSGLKVDPRASAIALATELREWISEANA